MDTCVLWYRGVRYCCESLANTTSSIVRRPGDHPAWNAVLLFLAQARFSLVFQPKDGAGVDGLFAPGDGWVSCFFAGNICRR
jgi:hypothetical protein